MCATFRRSRRGNVATIFALMAVPIMLTVGGAIDYSRSVHFRAELQGMADSAALAGAALWQGGTTATTATTAANNYLTAGEARLPANSGIATNIATNSLTTGYQVVVTASTNMTTTFLGLIMPSIAVAVSATALNPFPYGHFSPGFGSSSTFSAAAADTNTVYWYYVPADNSVPPDSALTLLWSNASGCCATPAPIPLNSTQQIGFAMRNTTGNYGTQRVNGVTSYIPNQYGSTKGHTQTFYSHLNPPTNSTNGYNSSNNPSNWNGVNGATGNNCSLQVVVVAANGTAPSPNSGVCSTSLTPPSYAAPTCAQLAGKQVVFYWNDMGGPYKSNGTGDDKDYNATGPQSIVLTQ